MFNKYKVSTPRRFFYYKNSSFKKNGVWIHSCSLGETRAIAPIVNNLKYHSNITVITDTGFKEAQKYQNSDIRFLPFEIFLPFWITKQRAIIVLEAELWYMLFVVAKAKGAKTYLINARINTKSYNKYLKFRWFYLQIFKNIDTVLAQSEDDKQRLQTLGAKNVIVAGNIKLATKIKPNIFYQKPQGLIITAGSTHDGEEEIILRAFDSLLDNKKLFIVPRHPQRFEQVNKIIKNFIKDKNYTYSKFKDKDAFDSDIILVDVMGELINIYQISDIVILGGGFKPMGGHNPLEPATFGVKLISGDKIFNQKSLFNLIDNYVLTNNNNLTNTLLNHANILPSFINTNINLDIYNNELKEFINPIKI